MTPTFCVCLSEEFVRGSYKGSLLVIFAILLACTIASAMPTSPASVPIGIVVETNRSLTGTGGAPEGAAIYDGDLLETRSDMTLQALVNRSQILLRANSQLEIQSLSRGFSANLLRGTVSISSSQGEVFQVHADGAMIIPIGTEPAAVQITWISATALLLGSSRGRVEVSMGDEASILEPGTFYRLEIQPADTGTQNNPRPGTEHGDCDGCKSHGPHPTARNRFVWIAIPAIAAVTGVVIWRALVSPTAP
jgi:hypothetical protein